MICLKIRTFVVSATTIPPLGYSFYSLWFAWKFVPLWYQQQLICVAPGLKVSCDLLENSYLCGISNNHAEGCRGWDNVVICLKIRTFVVSATTIHAVLSVTRKLWFAWKFVPLWYQQQPFNVLSFWEFSCDLLENSYLCGISNNWSLCIALILVLWFAWKFVPLWYQQQRRRPDNNQNLGCDLLENSYLCGISNNSYMISIVPLLLWFAWKFVPLWYQQQLIGLIGHNVSCCDLLENSYLCGISNNINFSSRCVFVLWFAWKFVPLWYQQQHYWQTKFYDICCDLLENSYLCGISNNNARALDIRARGCDLLENSYLCGISNNSACSTRSLSRVVICLKIRTFVVSATTLQHQGNIQDLLWFAWKFVPLWYQQQLTFSTLCLLISCDLLENSYLCGISNN